MERRQIDRWKEDRLINRYENRLFNGQKIYQEEGNYVL